MAGMVLRLAFLGCFLAGLAPSGASAQWWGKFSGVPFYNFEDAPLPAMKVVICEASDQAFASEAEVLITFGVDAKRAEFAPNAPPLVQDGRLIRIAQRRSCDIAQKLVPFSHVDAEGRFIAGAMVRARFGPHGATGENLMETDGTRTFDAEDFAGAAVEGWMGSPDHRANILNPGFGTSGVGVAKIGAASVATQIFHGPAAK